jgi:creatinine amidohydrolase
MALKPELVDMSQAANAVGPTAPELATVIGTAAAHRWQSFRVRTSHGAIGDPRAASAEKGERLLAAAANAVASLIANNEFWNAPA